MWEGVGPMLMLRDVFFSLSALVGWLEKKRYKVFLEYAEANLLHGHTVFGGGKWRELLK